MERLEGEPKHNGWLGWLAVGAVVVAWDVNSKDSMSASYARGLEKHPVLTLGATALTVAHLMDLIPERYDPFDVIAKYFPN